jgi:hypothetical protein
MKGLNLKMRVCFAFLVAMLIFAFTINPVHAQQNVGGISGFVRDSSGGMISGAQVVATQVQTGLVYKTATKEGAYSFPSLPIGEYVVSVTQPGFRTEQRTNLRVIASEEAPADFTLVPGTVTETVTVTATAPVVDATSTTTGTTRVTEEISDLPLANQGGARNSLQFLRTMPGVTLPDDVEDIVQTERGIVQGVGGTAATTLGQFFTSYDIDGTLSSLDLSSGPREDGGPIPEDIAEFRQATNLDAEYGGNLGSTIQLVTKSGTNQLHGSVFEYFRNTVLDAKNWFASSQTPEQQNEFGVAIGGPVIKNKWFFFGSYDGYRFHTAPAGVIATVPTPDMLAGNFSEWLGPQIGTDQIGRPVYQGEIYDPSTTRPDGMGGFLRDPFMYNGQLNVIDPARLSSLSKIFQAGYPAANAPGVANNWIGADSPSPVTMDKVAVKVDGSFGKNKLDIGYQGLPRKDQIYGAVAFAPTISQNVLVDTHEYHFQFNYSRTLSPNLLFSLRTGASRAPRTIGAIGLPSATFGATAGMKGYYTPETPNVGIAAMTGFGVGLRNLSDPSLDVPVYADLAWSKGSHQLKFGAEYLNLNAIENEQAGGGGSFSFGPGETGLPAFPLTGVGYASYLLGEVDYGGLSSPVYTKHSTRYWSFYGQDQWRVNQKLTFNYGLRWEFSVPPWETNNEMASFDPNIPNPGAGGLPGAVTFWGDGPGRNGLRHMVDTYYKAFGPRLGLAYAVTPKTVVRAYYGILYAPEAQDNAEGAQMPSYGYSASLSDFSHNGGVTPAFQWDGGWPTPLPTLPNVDPTIQNGGSVYYEDPFLSRRPPMSQNLGLTLQRELPGGMLLEASYVGKLTDRIAQNVNINSLNPKYLSLGFLLDEDINSPQAIAAGYTSPYPGFTGTVQDALLPYPQYPGGVTFHQDTQNAFYHSLETKLQKHFGHGLSFLVGYTFSKELDSQYGLAGIYAPQMKVRSVLDRPQSLAISYTYDLPIGHGKQFLNVSNGALAQIVGGWSVAGIHTYETGIPIALTTPANLTGQPLRTPGINCGNLDPLDPTKDRFLNAGAFSAAAPFTLPSTIQLQGVNTCGFLNENISVIKQFPVTERVHVDFTAEFFNIFNRHDWESGIYTQGVDTNILDPAGFGRYGTSCTPYAICSAATDPRVVEFNLKVAF